MTKAPHILIAEAAAEEIRADSYLATVFRSRDSIAVAAPSPDFSRNICWIVPIADTETPRSAQKKAVKYEILLVMQHVGGTKSSILMEVTNVRAAMKRLFRLNSGFDIAGVENNYRCDTNGGGMDLRADANKNYLAMSEMTLFFDCLESINQGE